MMWPNISTTRTCRARTEDKQNITTYTIGFNIHSQHDLLDRTAAHGHGRYYYTENAQQLSDAFQNIIGDILEGSSSFVAPIVPVSRMERTTAGDKIYLALFKPVRTERGAEISRSTGWPRAMTAAGVHTGDILDTNGVPALSPEGHFLRQPIPTGHRAEDGGKSKRGGVGEVLMNRSSARNIYTYLGTNTDLTHSSNAFTTANSLLTPGLFGFRVHDQE